MRKTLTSLALGMGLLVLGGCAKVPTDEIQAADQSIEKATAAEAAAYAPESMQAVTDARARLETEMKAQEERNALFRSYDEAKKLAAEVKSSADKAEIDAIEGRSRAREEAASLIAEVRSTVEEVKSMLEKAPRGKGTESDLVVLKGDVSGIEKSLADMESNFTAERYLESKAKAQAALNSAQDVRSQIQRAMDAKRAAVRRG